MLGTWQKKHDGEEKAEHESLDKTKDAETGEQDKSITAAEDADADVSSTTIFIKVAHLSVVCVSIQCVQVVPPNWKRAELQKLLQSACLKFSEPIASKVLHSYPCCSALMIWVLTLRTGAGRVGPTMTRHSNVRRHSNVVRAAASVESRSSWRYDYGQLTCMHVQLYRRSLYVKSV